MYILVYKMKCTYLFYIQFHPSSPMMQGFDLQYHRRLSRGVILAFPKFDTVSMWRLWRIT